MGKISSPTRDKIDPTVPCLTGAVVGGQCAKALCNEIMLLSLCIRMEDWEVGSDDGIAVIE